MVTPNWEALFEAIEELELPQRGYPYSDQGPALDQAVRLRPHQGHHGVSEPAQTPGASSRGTVPGGTGESAAPEDDCSEVQGTFRLGIEPVAATHGALQPNGRCGGQHRQRGLDLNACQRECLAQEAT